MAAEILREAIQYCFALCAGSFRWLADNASPGIAGHSCHEKIPAGIYKMVPFGTHAAHQFRCSMQKQGDFEFPGVHILSRAGSAASVLPSFVPVLTCRVQGHAPIMNVGLLDHVGEHVVSAVPVDYHELVDAAQLQCRVALVL